MVSIVLNDILASKGGPSGYLNNLNESIIQNNSDNIKIFHKKEDVQSLYSINIRKVKHFIKKYLKLRKNLLSEPDLSFYRNTLRQHIEEISNSSILHFHTTYDLYCFAKVYDIEKKTVLLTSHSPEPSYLEEYAKCIDMGYSIQDATKSSEQRKDMDLYAFNHADYIVFPCEGAVSPYNKFFEDNNIDKNKLRYIITSSRPLIPKVSIVDFKSKYSIPKNKKIISYVGRKNKIKGFDIFCKIAEKLRYDNRFYFISAGIGNIKAPIQDNFLDIGWTDDPASLVNSSDIQIVPNRDTYFDLGIIQALSLNTKIITTNTGGNSWFLDKNIDMYFADFNDINSFLEVLNNEDTYIKSNKNIDLYNNIFDNKKFSENYNLFYKEIMNEL